MSDSLNIPALPDVPTFESRLRGIKIGDAPLSDRLIDMIRSIPEFRDNLTGKHLFIELTGIIHALGENAVYDLLRNKGDTPLEDLIMTTDVFQTERRREFMEATKALKERKTTVSIIKCPKCRSNNVQTRTIQRRAGDEASTDENMCLSCNHRFSIN